MVLVNYGLIFFQKKGIRILIRGANKPEKPPGGAAGMDDDEDS